MSVVQEPADSPKGGTHGAWSIRLLSVFGIPIRIHFTFLLFLTWIAIATQDKGILWPLFVVAIFACVLLHELGHALTARRFHVMTRDITLYPIGGVAMLEGHPTARQELWISLAGPAVNLMIAGVLAIVQLAQGHSVSPVSNVTSETFLTTLMYANLTLCVFNLLPAFPMDGGRVLRAALALRMPDVKATQIAASVGQGLAILIGFAGLFTGQLVLMLIAFFVFVGAGQELSASVTRAFLVGHKVADAMQVRYRTIESGATLEAAAQMLLAGSQHDFPVVNGEEVLGILTRNQIAEGLATEGPTAYVAGYMDRELKTAHPNVPLERILDQMSRDDSTPLLVMDEGRLIGMITQENLGEFIMLQHARAQMPRRP